MDYKTDEELIEYLMDYVTSPDNRENLRFTYGSPREIAQFKDPAQAKRCIEIVMRNTTQVTKEEFEAIAGVMEYGEAIECAEDLERISRLSGLSSQKVLEVLGDFLFILDMYGYIPEPKKI